MHDIAKRGEPDIFKNDFIHPFQSAKTTLQIFRRLGFLDAELEMYSKRTTDNDKLEQVLGLIE